LAGVKSPTQLADAFRAQGLKVTPQRQLLFSLLEDNTTHPTADGLYAVASAQMPGISLRTVYTTLTGLVDMGELQAVTLGSGVTRFDPNVTDHHHGVCDECATIIDLYVDGSDSLVVDGADGFTAHSTSIIFFRGPCATCAAADLSISTPNKEHHHG
jgi:Fur family peroxide stress response transcriptional regulator